MKKSIGKRLWSKTLKKLQIKKEKTRKIYWEMLTSTNLPPSFS